MGGTGIRTLSKVPTVLRNVRENWGRHKVAQAGKWTAWASKKRMFSLVGAMMGALTQPRKLQPYLGPGPQGSGETHQM